MGQIDIPNESTLTQEAADGYFRRWESNLTALAEMLAEISHSGDLAAFSYAATAIEKMMNLTFQAMKNQAQAPADPRAN